MDLSTVVRSWSIRLLRAAAVLLLFLLALWNAYIAYIEISPPQRLTESLTCIGAYVPAHSSAIRRAWTQVEAIASEREIPGLSVAVAANGMVVWSMGLGYADLEGGHPVCPETEFRIASLSKLFAVATMARLVEEGKLNLDVPLDRYVPGFPDKGHRLTVRQVAAHRSGIRGYRDGHETLNTHAYGNVRESLEYFWKDPLEFPPDSRYLYSSFGYVLLSAALEGASGMDYQSLLKNSIIDPFDLRSTREEQAGRPGPHQATFYDREAPNSENGLLIPAPPNDFSNRRGAAGLLSTAEDLVRFGSRHMEPYNSGFLERETLETLFTPLSGIPGFFGHGLGWSSGRDLHFREFHIQFGATSGGTAVLILYPQSRVAVALLANLGHARFPLDRLSAISEPFLDDPAPLITLVGMGIALLLLGLTKQRSPDLPIQT